MPIFDYERDTIMNPLDEEGEDSGGEEEIEEEEQPFWIPQIVTNEMLKDARARQRKIRNSQIKRWQSPNHARSLQTKVHTTINTKHGVQR